MYRNFLFSCCIPGLVAAVPQGHGPYGTPSPPVYSPSSNQSSTSYNYPSHGPPPYAPSSAEAPHITVTDHVTITDHVTATNAPCGASIGSSNSGPSAAANGGPVNYAQDSQSPPPPSPEQGPPQGPSDSSPTNVAPAPPPPGQTLIPAAGPDHDANDLTHLEPATSGNLYYANNKDTSLSHMFASLDLEYTKPAVVLENSAYIFNVTCATDGLALTFTSDQGYDYAKTQWPTFGGDFILVSHSDGCKNSTDERTFWQVTDTTFDDEANACGVKCTEVNITDAATNMKAKWGNFNTDDSSSAPPAPQITVAPVMKRQGIIGDLTKAAGDAVDGVTGAAGDVWDGATSVGADVWSDATSGVASLATEAATAAIEAGKATFNKDLHLNLKASPTAKAGGPWPNAAPIISYKSVDAYCVDCGVDGHADVVGEAEISFVEVKIKSGSFKLSGNLAASLGLGLESKEGVSVTPLSKEFELVQVPLSPITIPQLLVIGPYINVKVGLGASINAQGKLLVGAGVSLPNFNANLDLVDSSKNSQSGFEPKWTHKFDVEGAVTVSLDLSLPVELGLGLDIKPLPDLNASVTLTDTFGITGYGNYSNAPGPCQYGVGWGVTLKESLVFAAADFYEKELNSWDQDIASGCFENVLGPNNKSSSAVGTPTPAPGGSSSSSSTAKVTGTQYTPTYTPTGAGTSTPTAKESGSQYHPTYSPPSPTSTYVPSTSTTSTASTRNTVSPSTESPSERPTYQPPSSSTRTHPTTTATSETDSPSTPTTKATTSSTKSSSTEEPSSTKKSSTEETTSTTSSSTTSSKKHTPTPEKRAEAPYNPPE